MIIRWWRAVAGSQAVLDQYADHLERTTFREMAELPGHLGASSRAPRSFWNPLTWRLNTSRRW